MPLSRYHQLIERVDGHFDRVHRRHRARMQCDAGCAACCQPGLSVTLVEAAHIAAARPPAMAAVRADRCAALGPDERCRIYAVRPLVCRSHGVPVRTRRGGLPVVGACERNFDDGAVPEDVPGGDVLDQETLSTVLGAVDAAFCDQVGAERGERVELAALLADPAALFDVE